MKYGIEPNIYFKLLICMNNRQFNLQFTLVQFSDLGKNWHFSTPIIVNIFIPPSRDPNILESSQKI